MTIPTASAPRSFLALAAGGARSPRRAVHRLRAAGALAVLAALVSMASGAAAQSGFGEEPNGGAGSGPTQPNFRLGGSSGPAGGTGGAFPSSTLGTPGTAADAMRSQARTGPVASGNEGGQNAGNDARRARKPADPTEFQSFVQGATGRLLPIFGSSYFAEGSASPGGDTVPVAGDYVVGPGDEVFVRVWGSVDADIRSTVDRNGLLHIPRVGSFTVAGTPASRLEAALRAQIGRLFTNFNLNVTLGQLRGVKVFVAGAGAQVGVLNLPSPATMLSAVMAAGGPAPSGSMRKITLRRAGAAVAEMDLYDLFVNGDRSKDTQLLAGDVIVFEPAGPRVALTGTVDRAAIYELKPAGEPLANLLRYAGGAPVLADRSRAILERIDPANTRAPRQVLNLGLDGAGPQFTLRDGDVLTLQAMPERFENAVTLRGPVANPARYPFVPGMRVKDLIPDRSALVPADVLRRRNELVQVLPTAPREQSGAVRRADTTASTVPGGETAPSLRPIAADPFAPNANPATSAANNQRMATDTLLGAQAAGSRNLDASGRPLPYDEVAARSRVPTPLFPDLNWDYAVIERLDEAELKTQIIPFNLGRAVLQGDPEHNLLLKPGDVVTLYRQQDLRGPLSRQTRLVTIDGEVQSPGVYQLAAGETLRTLVQRAGGITPQAYLYGLEFSREATRQRQRENLASAITRLEALAATQTARDAANRRDDNQTGAVSAAATQAQLARLRQLQPNGRIALELDPAVSNVMELPDVPLEHGDRVTVPPRAGFVTVAGAVVNSNAFLWRPDRTVGDYLRLAGVDEAADPGNTFVLRADGTVMTAADNRGIFKNRLQGLSLQPGDAVIVPNQLDFETFGRALVRNLKDWSQILANFGIGAAAIKTLRE